MLNYYGILQINQCATNEEIKKSFRNLAKKYHPDKNCDNQEWAEEKIKLVIKAYKILIDSKLREHYDTTLQYRTNKPDTVPEKKEDRKNDINFEIKSILNDLVHNSGQSAIDKFETLNGRVQNFSLQKYLTGRDYLDCVFLLAEEYEKNKKYTLALKLYKNIYDLEKDKKNDISHNYFFDETKSRIKKYIAQN